MGRTSAILAIAAALVVTAGLPAAGSAQADEARANRTPSQKGAEDPRLATRSMWSLHWHDDWKDAVLLNRIERRKPALIFHLRILGDLAAKT